MSSTSAHSNRLAFLTRWFRRHDDERAFDASPQRGGVISRQTNGHTATNGNGDDHEPRGPRRWLMRRRSTDTRQRSLAQLQQAYEEVIDLVDTLKHHMEAQSERSERLLAMMEGLPEALKSLPEANRNQTQTLQVIEGHLKQQNQQSEGLTQAIQGLAKAAGNQEHAMNLIQQQLDAGQDSREQLHQNFSALGDTLGQMSQTNHASTQLLTRLNEKHEQSDAQMQQLVARNQRQMTMMAIVSWSLAIVALAVAGAVAVWVGQQMGDSSPAAGAGSAQVAGFVQPGETASEPAAHHEGDAAPMEAVDAPDAPDALDTSWAPTFDPYAKLLDANVTN